MNLLQARKLMVSVTVYSLISIYTTCYSADYNIKLQRPHIKTQRINKEAVNKMAINFSSLYGDKVVNSNKRAFNISYSGVETINKVDGNGHPMEIESLINNLSLESAGKTNILLPKDTILTVKTIDGKKVYSTGGEELPAGIKQYISDIISTYNPKSQDFDLLYGTSKKVNIGDSWSINSELVEKEIESGIFEVSDVKGKSTLQKVIKVGKIKCLIIYTTISAKVDKYKTTNTVAQSGSVKMTLRGFYPVDTTLQPLREMLDVKMDIKFATPNTENGSTKLEITMKSEKKSINLEH